MVLDLPRSRIVAGRDKIWDGRPAPKTRVAHGRPCGERGLGQRV
jgi:hypothetical protein